MRYPKKTYPKAFSVLFGILAAAFILFLIWLGVQPAEPSKLSQTEDSQSDFASVSDPAASRQESNDEISQSDAVLEPPSDDKSLDTFVDWRIGWELLIWTVCIPGILRLIPADYGSKHIIITLMLEPISLPAGI